MLAPARLQNFRPSRQDMKRVAQRQARSSKIVWKIGCGEITIEPAAFLPRLQERIGLSSVLVGSPVEQVLQPNVNPQR